MKFFRKIKIAVIIWLSGKDWVVAWWYADHIVDGW